MVKIILEKGINWRKIRYVIWICLGLGILTQNLPQYIQNSGVLGFKNGGYLSYNVPKNTHIPKFSLAIHKVGSESIIMRDDDTDIHSAHAFSGILAVYTNEAPTDNIDGFLSCIDAKNKDSVDISSNFSFNKKYIVCKTLKANEGWKTIIAFQVKGRKIGMIETTLNNENDAETNKNYITEIVNSAEYKPSLLSLIL